MITYRNLGRLGRLGNELFQYAGTRLYAHLHGFKHAFPAWEGSQQLFRATPSWSWKERVSAALLHTIWLDDTQHTTPAQRVREYLGLSSRISMRDLWLNPQDNRNLYGYLQDQFTLQTLGRHRALVQSWLSFKTDFDAACRSVTPNTHWIGLHIRRGDFTKRNLSVPLATFQERLRFDAVQIPLYIASDDPSVAIEFQDFPIVHVKPPHGVSRVHFDFWMLRNSISVYGGGSTFSWWAAYLSDGATYIAPPLTHTWTQGYVPSLTEQSFL